MLDRILCVDDDPITLMLCKKVIHKAQFSKEIVTAKNGLEALTYLNDILKQNEKNKLPQLIFLDLNMPVMDGWEFLDNFNSAEYDICKAIKVIILSSTIDPEDYKKAKTYPNVFDFIPKPISTSILTDLSSKF